MKKTLITLAIVAVVLTVGVGAYAHYEGNTPQRGRGMGGFWNQMMPGQWGDNMMYGQRGGQGGRGHGMMNYGWNQQNQQATCPCGGQGFAPGQTQTAPELITEEKVKEVAETYVNQYLPGYTVETIAKDAWRPMYIVTIKGENNAEMQMLVHGFGGQVMHLFPKAVEEVTE